MTRFFHFLMYGLILFEFCSSSITYAELENTYKNAFQTLISLISQKCASECSKPLISSLMTFLLRKNYVNFLAMCGAQESLVGCISDPKNGCTNGESLLLLTSGIQFVCLRKKETFEKILPCVNKHAPNTEAVCSGECKLNSELQAWSESMTNSRRNIKSIVNKADPICRPFACHLSCSKRQINDFCPNAGDQIVKIFTYPLDRFREILEEHKGNRGLKRWMKSIPEDCVNLMFQKEDDFEPERKKEKMKMPQENFWVGYELDILLGLVAFLSLLTLVLSLLWCYFEIRTRNAMKCRRISFV